MHWVQKRRSAASDTGCLEDGGRICIQGQCEKSLQVFSITIYRMNFSKKTSRKNQNKIRILVSKDRTRTVSVTMISVCFQMPQNIILSFVQTKWTDLSKTKTFFERQILENISESLRRKKRFSDCMDDGTSNLKTGGQ